MTQVIIKKSKNPKKKYETVIEGKKQFHSVLQAILILLKLKMKTERQII